MHSTPENFWEYLWPFRSVEFAERQFVRLWIFMSCQLPHAACPAQSFIGFWLLLETGYFSQFRHIHFTVEFCSGLSLSPGVKITFHRDVSGLCGQPRRNLSLNQVLGFYNPGPSTPVTYSETKDINTTDILRTSGLVPGGIGSSTANC